MRTEQDFIDAIDCNFPYNDLVGGKALILEAKTFGIDSVFCLCCELCDIPHGTKVSDKNMLLFFNFLKENISFKGYEFVLELMEKHFSGIEIMESEILEAMFKVELLGEHLSIIALLSTLDKNYSDRVEEMYFYFYNKWNRQ